MKCGFPGGADGLLPHPKPPIPGPQLLTRSDRARSHSRLPADSDQADAGRKILTQPNRSKLTCAQQCVPTHVKPDTEEPEPGVVHTCNPNSRSRRLQDSEASLGYTIRACLKTSKQITISWVMVAQDIRGATQRSPGGGCGEPGVAVAQL